MKGKTISVLAVLGFLCCPSLGDKDGVLYLHLPRTVCVKFQNLQLGSIAAVRGGEAKLVAKAMEVPMGRSPSSGEKIVIDRHTILSRLGTLGFNAKAVRFTGASEVAVMRDEATIEAERLIKSAESFLQKTRPGPPKCGWRLTKRPKKLMVPVGEKIRLMSALADAAPVGYVKVKVSAFGDNRQYAQTEILFKLVYPVRQTVATKEIRVGQIVTPDNAKIRTIHVESTPRSDWTSPYGMLAARIIPVGHVIRPRMVKTKTSAIVVRRNQRVTMKIEGLGFKVTAMGQALQDGRAGERIKVRNIDSRRIVLAEVAFDGTVSPIPGAVVARGP
ncbi:MAG TPA: flagellar basal body P-ring formation protein FlgA [Phycisphaerae bacterium]|nr:flagellar basal body P-ring formation protein FlgA [Phycisphaerae bacterium]